MGLVLLVSIHNRPAPKYQKNRSHSAAGIFDAFSKLKHFSRLTIRNHSVIYPCSTHPSTILYALSTLDLAYHEALKMRYKHIFTQFHRSHHDLLDDPAISAIYICAPVVTRYHLAVKALQAGKHVLCECPVADEAGKLRELYKIAEERGLILLDGVSFFQHVFTSLLLKVFFFLYGALNSSKSLNCTLKWG